MRTPDSFIRLSASYGAAHQSMFPGSLFSSWAMRGDVGGFQRYVGAGGAHSEVTLLASARALLVPSPTIATGSNWAGRSL